MLGQGGGSIRVLFDVDEQEVVSSGFARPWQAGVELCGEVLQSSEGYQK
jgi:hypothetical protein